MRKFKFKWSVLFIIIIIFALAGGCFALHQYCKPVSYHLDAQMCNKEGDVHNIVIDLTFYRYLVRDNELKGMITVDDISYSGTGSWTEGTTFEEVLDWGGVFYPANGEQGKEKAVFFLGNFYYKPIQLWTITYSDGEGSHLYYAPASTPAEYNEQFSKLQEFVFSQWHSQ